MAARARGALGIEAFEEAHWAPDRVIRFRGAGLPLLLPDQGSRAYPQKARLPVQMLKLSSFAVALGPIPLMAEQESPVASRTVALILSASSRVSLGTSVKSM
nr:hypothetical protein [Holophaga foetida]